MANHERSVEKVVFNLEMYMLKREGKKRKVKIFGLSQTAVLRHGTEKPRRCIMYVVRLDGNLTRLKRSNA